MIKKSQMVYHFDNWVLLKIRSTEDKDEIFVLLGSTNSSYLHGCSWRMSSPIVEIDNNSDEIVVKTSSGSTYSLSKEREQLHVSFSHIWEELKSEHKDKIQIIKMSDYLGLKNE